MCEKSRHTRSCFSVELVCTKKHKASLTWLWSHVVVTKILTTKHKKQEEANNSVSYQFALIKIPIEKKIEKLSGNQKSETAAYEQN